ncbi:MAG: segregation and condensation protein [Fibrobacterota bacterium]|jgi:segregation and condensation protein B
MQEEPRQEGNEPTSEGNLSIPVDLDLDEGDLPYEPQVTESVPNESSPLPVAAFLVDPSGQDNAYSDGEELDLEEPSIPRPDDEVLLEAALFASTELLTLRHLRELVDSTLTAAKVQKLVDSTNRRLTDGKHPFEIVSAAGGWRLRTRPELYPWLRGLFKEVQNRRLSQAVLETLAVVAYKQPITKAEIEAVRGVSADGALKKLLEKKLVTVSGRTDTPGRPLTYGTTREFLEYFGISKLPDDLPRLAEFEELVQSRSLLPQVAPGGVLLQAQQQEE